ncbi:hypothetical protein U472_13370 [Orenia metallireducens]|uniref:Sporulation membrane protein YtrI C-terminal domain-containing protein n=1 Tax=Orenia metallireducens TaxID=1413210 RepID=A0A1C0A5C5_9FIRM|nr:hypothetical protein [Orenia metallireducens]OCL25341.1 hypothetical protein U472_13370 [Orenia metallireducens]
MSFNFLTLTKNDILRLFASFLLGMITGITILNLLVGPQLDQLIFEREELLSEIESQQTTLDKLEESLAEERRKVIQDLTIEIENKIDKHIKQELKKDIFEILKSLIGRDISKVDGKLLAETLDGRIIIVEKKSYKLNFLWIIIQPNAIISFKIIEEK